MIYLKSLGVGALARALSLVVTAVSYLAVIAIWGPIAVETTRSPWGVRTTTIRASVHNVPIDLFLAVALVIFAIGFYWEFHRVAVRQRAR